jgi:hypothetical protein
MVKHGSGRWKRLRDSIATDLGDLAAGSAVVDTYALLAVTEAKLATRRRSGGTCPASDVDDRE